MREHIGLEAIALRMCWLHVRVFVRAALRQRDDVIERPFAWIELFLADAARALSPLEDRATVDSFNENAESQCSAFSAG